MDNIEKKKKLMKRVAKIYPGKKYFMLYDQKHSNVPVVYSVSNWITCESYGISMNL